MLHAVLPGPLFLKSIASQSCPNNNYKYNSRTMRWSSYWYVKNVPYRKFLTAFCAHRYILYNVLCAKMKYRELQQTTLPTTMNLQGPVSLIVFKGECFAKFFLF